MTFPAMTDRLSSALNDAVKIPEFQITMQGKPLNAINERLLSLSLTDNRAFNADQLQIVIDDTDSLLQLPARGVVLQVFLGWKGEALVFKGTYIVDEIGYSGPPDTLRLTAHSADFREALNVKREVSWHDVRLERVISAIAHRYGLTAHISDVFMDIEIDHADQNQESDMSFLTRMSDELGAITTIKNGILLFILPGRGLSASGKPLPCATFTRSSGDRHVFRLADRDAYSGVRAYWLDLNAGKKKKINVEKIRKKEENQSYSREGHYTEGEEGNVFVLKKTYPSETVAIRAAVSKWQQLQRGAAEFSLTLSRGGAELYPEMPVTLNGFKTEIDKQNWIISRVEHVIDQQGFTTRLELEVRISDWIVRTD